jgi:hypothetical protein
MRRDAFLHTRLAGIAQRVPDALPEAGAQTAKCMNVG